MKFTTKCLFGIFASMLCLCNANAAQHNCPEGCFCLNNGKYDDNIPLIQIDFICNAKSHPIVECYGDGYSYDGDAVISCHHTPTPSYYFEQFSELYGGDIFGYYGVINGQMIYMTKDFRYQSVFSCPDAYPQSDPGAKTVYECYTYDQHGNKVYYSISASTGSTGGSGTGGSMSGGHGGTTSTVTCAEGTYLPANATECEPCSASMHHICSGGTFSTRNNKKIQGLKVECYPGEYLPQGAMQCSACDSEYLCIGGIYNVGGSGSVGAVMNTGYIFHGNHTVEVCNPGYYMPGNSQTCVACTGNYACPGGVFYTSGGPYQSSRGRIYCAYGYANGTHTKCISTSTSPSSIGQQPQVATNTQQQQPEMASNPQPQPTSQQLIKPIKKGNQRLPTFKTVQQMQPVQTVQPTQTTQTASTTESDTEMTEQQKKLELAKKLISAGVAAPVMQ